MSPTRQKPNQRFSKHPNGCKAAFSRAKLAANPINTCASSYEKRSVLLSCNRLAKVKITKDGEAAKVTYLHNALGQRVFKGEPTADQVLLNASTLGTTYIDWLKKNFAWMFATAQANTSVGTAFTYADEQLPSWAILGEYDNGSAKGAGRSEYIWLPTEDGSATPVGMYRNSKFFAVHADHLGTPRLLTNDTNTPVWQWPYSAFGNNKPTGVLKATPNPRAALTNVPVLLRATAATEFNLRFPGQYADDEAGNFHNLHREYLAGQGRYTQGDPIGLQGGLNRHGYVGGNSLSFTDPEGKNPVLVVGGMVLTGYGVYSTLKDVRSCKTACEMTHGDAVQACESERQDIVDGGKFRRVEKCKAGCALTAIFDTMGQNYSIVASRTIV